jgi:hypothetical protein
MARLCTRRSTETFRGTRGFHPILAHDRVIADYIATRLGFLPQGSTNQRRASQPDRAAAR